MKRAFNIEEQIERLKSYGLVFDNEEKSKEILLDIGYYRFGFYLFPFEKSYPDLNNRNHALEEGTTFKSVYELYSFDTKLRRILLDALDRIEVNIRTKITYYASNRYRDSPTWFVNPNIMKDEFLKSFEEKVYGTIKENPVIKRHHKKYINDRYAPAWKTIEFMTLGNITNLYRSFKSDDMKEVISSQYGCTYGVFLNYLETIRIIRNKCAHGGCVYGIEIPVGIKKKPAEVGEESRHNINGAITVVAYILGKISQNRRNDFLDSIRVLINKERSKRTNEIIDKCTKIQR